ncbi:hypothetical protein JN757_05470 [Pseudomonas granadensis]|uniref:Uncharacterized protein n=1 Tax=Pseudomonas granadensis TaxID=1421430 RepID=A0ABX7GJ53_9PSED|nr:hypothetical protein [Pseudomonas granadensis]QRK85224.1 hypothetical protein JN757_05470 [Pseudomonas granadensis]
MDDKQNGQNDAEQASETKGFPTKLLSEPQNKLNLNSLLLHLLHLETKDVTIKWVFDIIRNYVICGVVLWTGVNAFKLQSSTVLDTIIHCVGGVVLIITAITLFTLNMTHGIIGFAKVRNLKTTSTVLYIIGSLLAFSAANILFTTAK